MFLVLALVLPLAMMPVSVAQAQEGIPASEPPIIIPPPPERPVVEEIPLSIEVIENTRERAVVRVNDILITQEFDPESTKESAKATLRMEDLNTGEVEEIQITTLYEAGEYITTFYMEGRLLKTFTTAYDPLEPGVLRDHMTAPQIGIESEFSPQVTRFRWDGRRFVRSRDIRYPRPDVDFYGFCRYRFQFVAGNRLDHIQVPYWTTRYLLGLPAPVAFAVLGAAIGSAIGGVKGASIGAALGALFVGITQIRLEFMLVDDRGTIWANIHRCWMWFPVRQVPRGPRLLRVGRTTVWDHCYFTPPI